MNQDKNPVKMPILYLLLPFLEYKHSKDQGPKKNPIMIPIKNSVIVPSLNYITLSLYSFLCAFPPLLLFYN